MEAKNLLITRTSGLSERMFKVEYITQEGHELVEYVDELSVLGGHIHLFEGSQIRLDMDDYQMFITSEQKDHKSMVISHK